jgi:[ribosomal protein S18]-alanine N-acetyltransferase
MAEFSGPAFTKFQQSAMIAIRRGEARDLGDILGIQAACREAAQWDPVGYLNFDLLVAAYGIRVVGFLVGRTLAVGEHEILNLAVLPDHRRRGVGRSLLCAYLEASKGSVFLEVRPSNKAARTFYKSLGFDEVTVRPGYYENPSEPAIVMKFHSC